jgi:ABC-type polysaccharide/polyol phosphate transport system ATPase subunit
MANAVEVSNVTMKFHMAKEKIGSLKEYMLKFLKRELSYEDFTALDNVSFSVEKGDVFGIVGLNGSGKSTLLKLVSGILKPTAGTIRARGSISPLIELGAGFDMELTARENIYLNGSVLGYSKKFLDEQFGEIVAFSEMREFLDVPMKNYSSGMVARVAFAIATVVKPEILILDEILGVGDFLFQQKCEQRINDVMSGGTTVLLVSHSIGQIRKLCRHAAWLEHGKLQMVGDADDVCDAYQGKDVRIIGGVDTVKAMNTKAVYTAITGDYETLKAPDCVTDGWDYICFTDDPALQSDFWNVKHIGIDTLNGYGVEHADNPRRLGKFYKMFPHLLLSEYSETIWIDGSLKIVGNLDEYLSRYLQSSDMLCLKHPLRSCVYDEAETVINLGLAVESDVIEQISRYRADGMPAHYGLVSCSVLYRKNTEAMAKLNKLWYRETMRATPRDQLSFMYCMWKSRIQYDLCYCNCWHHPYFKYHKHKTEQNISAAALYIQGVDFGFSEQGALRKVLAFPDNRFDVSFEFQAQMTVVSLRFDPAEKPVKVQLDTAVLVDTNGNEISLAAAGNNSFEENDGYLYFATLDPNYLFMLESPAIPSHVRLSGRMAFLTDERYFVTADASYLEWWYPAVTGETLDLAHPVTFQEKLQWLKIYDRKQIYTRMADKASVRDFIKEVFGAIGADPPKMIPLLGIYDSVGDIDFEGLPNQFVLKCSHDSGSAIICKDKNSFDKTAACSKLQQHLDKSHYDFGREWPYKNIQPRIIAEAMLAEAMLADYKIFTFGGEPKYILCCLSRFEHLSMNIYDTDWNLTDAEYVKYPRFLDCEVQKPVSLGAMLEFARILSKDTIHLRVDFFEANGECYLSEITFHSGSGVDFWYGDWDKQMGDLIHLPKIGMLL